MKGRRWFVFAGLAALAVACTPFRGASSSEIPRISKEELKSLLGKPDVTVLDVRASHDWEAGKTKISGAIRQDPAAVDKWAAKYPKDRMLIAYCA